MPASTLRPDERPRSFFIEGLEAPDLNASTPEGNGDFSGIPIPEGRPRPEAATAEPAPDADEGFYELNDDGTYGPRGE